MRVETFFCYCFLIIVLFYFNITILFILPAGDIDFLEFYISFYAQRYLHYSDVISICGLEILFRLLLKEMIGCRNKCPVVSAG